MKLVQTEEGFALYKEKTLAGRCAFRQEGDCTWPFAPVDRSGLAPPGLWLPTCCGRCCTAWAATPQTPPAVLPRRCRRRRGRRPFWAKFGFRPEAGRLVRRRKPDLTAVRLAQEFLAARLQSPRLLVDPPAAMAGIPPFCAAWPERKGRCLPSISRPAALKATAARLEREGIPARRCRLVLGQPRKTFCTTSSPVPPTG